MSHLQHSGNQNKNRKSHNNIESLKMRIDKKDDDDDDDHRHHHNDDSLTSTITTTTGSSSSLSSSFSFPETGGDVSTSSPSSASQEKRFVDATSADAIEGRQEKNSDDDNNESMKQDRPSNDEELSSGAVWSTEEDEGDGNQLFKIQQQQQQQQQHQYTSLLSCCSSSPFSGIQMSTPTSSSLRTRRQPTAVSSQLPRFLKSTRRSSTVASDDVDVVEIQSSEENDNNNNNNNNNNGNNDNSIVLEHSTPVSTKTIPVSSYTPPSKAAAGRRRKFVDGIQARRADLGVARTVTMDGIIESFPETVHLDEDDDSDDDDQHYYLYDRQHKRLTTPTNNKPQIDYAKILQEGKSLTAEAAARVMRQTPDRSMSSLDSRESVAVTPLVWI